MIKAAAWATADSRSGSWYHVKHQARMLRTSPEAAPPTISSGVWKRVASTLKRTVVLSVSCACPR